MTTTSNHVTSPAKTGKSLSLDEYKNLTGDRQLQQMIQSAVTSALGQMYLDNPIPDHSNTEKSTMSTIDAKMKRCCISTEYGNIWVQGKTIPQMCQAFHEKMRMLEGASSDSQEEGANPLFEDYAQEWWDTYEAKRLSGGTKIDYDMNHHFYQRSNIRPLFFYCLEQVEGFQFRCLRRWLQYRTLDGYHGGCNK